MEKGVIRFEANVSVRPKGSKDFGTRTEVKNLNSFRALMKAVTYEIERQTKIVAQGGAVIQETVGWDEDQGVTVSQRWKEEAHDYRYFPEPDLPPLQVDQAWIDQVRTDLPELPHEKRLRFVRQYQLTSYAAGLLAAERSLADYFEVAVTHADDVPAIKVAHWLTGDLFALLNQAGVEIDKANISPQSLGELVAMVEHGEINATSGKEVLEEIFQSGAAPSSVVEARGLAQINDPQAIQEFVQQVLRENPQQVEQYVDGKTAIAQWLFGQVMRAAGGRANPAIAQSCLTSALEEFEKTHNE
jgi:aspartyl-tRNA(Asn)/glutamyl-tRNA(Gln) amidotransferase subunit B